MIRLVRRHRRVRAARQIKRSASGRRIDPYLELGHIRRRFRNGITAWRHVSHDRQRAGSDEDRAKQVSGPPRYPAKLFHMPTRFDSPRPAKMLGRATAAAFQEILSSRLHRSARRAFSEIDIVMSSCRPPAIIDCPLLAPEHHERRPSRRDERFRP